MNQSTLYIVATPIGNLADITYRAVETLRSVDIVFCEDTRVSKVLLEAYEIAAITDSFHAQSTASKSQHIIDLLKQGKNIALITDAGTPGISDPGNELVRDVRQACGDLVRIVPIPGASALTAALSVSGVDVSQFTFLGFLPHKKGRQTLFEEIAASDRAVVFYESPHRIMKTLESLFERMPERTLCIAREISKMFEEVKVATVAEHKAYFEAHQDKIRGEFVVIVAP
jgi:16S rRNA (cytidine1402-2'-O)-methyltransferase